MSIKITVDSQQKACSPIIYASPNSTSLIIDIPTSVSLAQHLHPAPNHYPLISSSPAPTVPYQSTEPKSDRAKANVVARNGGPENTIIDEHWLREAWEQLRQERKDATWCLDRNVRTEQRDGGKRKRAEEYWSKSKSIRRKAGIKKVEENASADPQTKPDHIGQRPPLRLQPSGQQTNAYTERPLDLNDINDRLVQNPESETVKLYTISLDPLPDASTYLIPPQSSFFQCTIRPETAAVFSQAVLGLHPHKSSTSCAGPGEFDVVVLDPPWQNRSVRNSRKYVATSGNGFDPSDPFIVLQEMLGKHISSGGTLACWITNKACVRSHALHLFRSCGVVLDEELVWLKVTTKGIPVLEISSLWRKPYEVCLIGKKCKDTSSYHKDETVGRRLLVAVPDIHSRKPCLRDILRPENANYRGLEVFARSLVANWCVWGDEVLSSAKQGERASLS